MKSARVIHTAMVLAAGSGTRMRPLTDHTCKALVRLGGKALIDHTLDRLEAAGIRRAVVNTHTYADQLEAHLAARSGAMQIVISDERDALLETGGGVVKALPLLGEAPVLICNIDAVWIGFEPVLRGLLDAWDATRMDELFLLAHKQASLGIATKGDFHLGADGRIRRAGPEGADWYYAGVEIFKPALAKGWRAEKFSRNLIWNETLKHKRAFGFALPGFWMHVGDPSALKAAEAVLKEAGK